MSTREMLYHRTVYKMRRSRVSGEVSSRYKTWVQPKWKPFTKPPERVTVCVTAGSLGVTTTMKRMIRSEHSQSSCLMAGFLLPARNTAPWQGGKSIQAIVLNGRGNVSSLQTSLGNEWDPHWGTALTTG